MKQNVRLDRPLLICAGLLCLVSLVALTSACATLDRSLVVRQAVWIGLGILASVAVASLPYTWWVDVGGTFLYWAVVLLLGVVLVAGTVRLGAARWLTIGALSIQPSELAKIATACWLARYLANQSEMPLRVRHLTISAGLAALPALLIFLQPDLGSSSVLAVMWLGTAWIAGMSKRHLALLAGGGLGLLPVAWHLLKDYQRARLAVFLNPHADPLGAGYTIIQSQIAIGSGKVLGRGWLAGTQNQLNFLPERHADFIYSVIGEEWGFVGAVALVALVGCLLWRAIGIALSTSDPRGRFLATALVSWIAYQAMVNMGMVIGLVPVVGVPLPLVSYGGSAMVTTWMALGLLHSIQRFGARF
jgi:rod shape determining protein RodA